LSPILVRSRFMAIAAHLTQPTTVSNARCPPPDPCWFNPHPWVHDRRGPRPKQLIVAYGSMSSSQAQCAPDSTARHCQFIVQKAKRAARIRRASMQQGTRAVGAAPTRKSTQMLYQRDFSRPRMSVASRDLLPNPKNCPGAGNLITILRRGAALSTIC